MLELRESSAPGRPQPLAVAIIGMLFFIFGFVTWLNGSLIPFLKIICQLDYTQAFLVTFAFYIAYTVMALPVAGVLERTGYRRGMAFGLAIMGIGALIHIPAAYLGSFGLFLVGLFTLGTGLAFLQTASNPYIVLVGPPESAARRISIMGIVNKAAGALAPFAFSSLVVARMGNSTALTAEVPNMAMRRALAGQLVLPYVVMAGILFVLAGLITIAPLPHVQPHQPHQLDRKRRLIDRPQLVFGVMTLFAYMGVEVIAGDSIGVLGSRLGQRNFLSLTSYTMAFMVVGYALGIVLIPRFLTQRTALCTSGALGLIGSAGAILSSPQSSGLSRVVWGWSGLPLLPDPLVFVAFLGLANAQVWPTVWPFALKGLGDATPRGSALLIMAISGGAVIPLLFGWLSTVLPTMQDAYLIALPCYAAVLLYGWRGCVITA